MFIIDKALRAAIQAINLMVVTRDRVHRPRAMRKPILKRLLRGEWLKYNHLRARLSARRMYEITWYGFLVPIKNRLPNNLKTYKRYAYVFATRFVSIYSLQFVDQLHLINWKKELKDPNRISPLVRLYLEHGTFLYEECLMRVRQMSLGHVQNTVETFAQYPLEQFVRLFYRNPRVADLVMSRFAHQGIEEDAVSLSNSRNAIKTNIKVIHAFWYLMHLSYHAGQGYLCGQFHYPMKRTQQRLLRHLPKPTEELRSRLKDVGVDSLEEMRLLSPDWTANIGHTGHLNVHLKMREMGWWQGKPVLLTYPERVANPFFVKLLENRCPNFIFGQNGLPSHVWHELASLMPLLEGPWHTTDIPGGESMYWNDAGSRAIAQWDAENRGYPVRDALDAHLLKDDRMMHRYENFRRQHGMSPSDWYVCLHMRDSNARNDIDGKGESIRNTAIDNYLDTVRLITQSGGWVIRMGGAKAPPFPAMERVIDYAHYSDKSPDMDIHLVRHAHVFIGTTSGFAYVASALGVPTVMVNSISSLGLIWSTNTRFALKHIFKADGQRLSIKEFTSEKYRWAYPTHEAIERAGLSVYDNSSDEILETTKEVLALANGEVRDADYGDAWQALVSTPHFFGSAKPARYLLDKYPVLLQP